MTIWDCIKLDDAGLIPAITQDADTGEVLMFAWMNREALQHTLETQQATYWSRSRRELWIKGQTSGHTQRVVEVRTDCDQDVILVKVRQEGAACHKGYRSCFFRTLGADGTLETVDTVLVDPETVYGKSAK